MSDVQDCCVFAQDWQHRETKVRYVSLHFHSSHITNGFGEGRNLRMRGEPEVFHPPIALLHELQAAHNRRARGIVLTRAKLHEYQKQEEEVCQ